MNIPFFSGEEVKKLLPMQECIHLMENLLSDLAKGKSLQPLRSVMWLPSKIGLLGMMPAYDAGNEVMGIKVLSVFPQNKAIGLSSHQGIVLLFDGTNGQPVCMADADEITAIRTAAVSAVATKYLSRKNSGILAVLGSGTQAATHIDAIIGVREIREIRIWSRSQKNANAFSQQTAINHKIKTSCFPTVEETITGADIITAVTASQSPVLEGKWIMEGVHINAVGACTPNARELDTAAVLKSKLFCDRYESLFNEAGDFLIPKKEGALHESHAKGELGEVIAGIKTGRDSEKEITLFKSLGLAIEDIASVFFINKKSTNRVYIE